ncbi:MAG: sulfatase-like hydrolase/transferase, partial [Thermoanaerobaculia bacterium]
LRGAGYATVAVVGSRVLDRRFGLDRGFDLYDDRMAAERTGEFGYPERPAGAVVDAALAATAATAAVSSPPLFLWVHFYDAHAPYEGAGDDARSRYRSEVEAIDRELGRLLDQLRPGRPRIVAVVGDHGESFGEHGESEHGYLLHEPTLAVPLVLSGPGVPAAGTRPETVGIRRLAATLVALAGVKASRLGGPALAVEGGESAGAESVYHETEFPASTFGWSPLAAVTRGSWRFVLGPQPALFDLATDPQERANRLREEPERVRSLRKELARLSGRARLAPPAAAPLDDELRRQLESLGYLSGATALRGTLDPAEGVLLLADFAAAKQRLTAGDATGARDTLRQLVGRSPQSVPFLSVLAQAEGALGEFTAARAALLAAAAVNPRNEFLATSLGRLEVAAGRPAEAEEAFRRALEMQPRCLPATLALGELLVRSGRGAEEEGLVRAAVAAGTESGVLLTRLGEIELRRGDVAGADGHLAEATRLLPEFATAWKLWAEVARRQNDAAAAAIRAARAAALQ